MTKERFINALLTVALCALFMLPVFVQAQALPSVPHPPTVSGNTYTYGGGSATSANAASVTFPSPANGPIYSESTQSQPVGGGRSVPVTVRSRPSNADIAKAVGRFATKAVGVIAVGSALYDLCQELGFGCGGGGGQPLTVTKNNPDLCTVGPCYRYAPLAGPKVGVYYNRASDACQQHIGVIYGTNYLSVNTVDGTGETVRCLMRYNNWDGTAMYTWFNLGSQLRSVDSATPLPSTIQDLENAIAAKSGWPASSALPRVLPEAIASGEALPLPKPYEITGPSSVPLPPEVIQMPDGSKITNQPEKLVQYGPDTVTVTDRSTKTETSSSGVTTPISVTTGAQPLPQPPTAAAETEKPKDPCGLPDTPKCVIDGAGTPTAEELPNDQAEKSLNPVKDFLQNPFSVIPQLPTINWAFALPTACGVVPLPAFAPFISGVDVCQFQPMFHEIMSVVWMLGALFGAIALFMRSSLAD
ncbi:hypothetical protein MCEMIEM13_01630 [Comamonadaceae bacterium]